MKALPLRICSLVLGGLVFASAHVHADSFATDVAEYLLANRADISRQIDFQARMLTHATHGQTIRNYWVEGSDHPNEFEPRGVEDYIMIRAASSQNLSFTNLIRPVSEVKRNRNTKIVRQRRGTRIFELRPLEEVRYCLVPHVPYTILALLELDPVADSDVVVLEAAFDQFAPLYGALLEAMSRAGIRGVSGSPSMTLGYFRDTVNYEEPWCTPRPTPSSGGRAKGVDNLLFPHLANGFDERANPFAEPMRLFADRQDWVSHFETLSLVQLSFLEKLFGFIDQNAAFFSLGRFGDSSEIFSSLETVMERRSEDFSDLDFGTVTDDDDDDDFNFFP